MPRNFFPKGDAHPTSDGVVQEQEYWPRDAIYRNGGRIDLDAPRSLLLGLFNTTALAA